MRAQFVLSEMAIGLRRNLTMTVAAVLTSSIALALLGVGLLLYAQVGTMKDYWYDKVEVSVFLCQSTSDKPECASGAVTAEQRTQIEADLRALQPQVEDVFYESKEEAYERFKEQFKNSAIVNNVTADQLPESFRVKLQDPEQYLVVATAVQGRPGVDEVADSRALLDRFFTVLNGLRNGALFIAVVAVVAMVLLIANTVQVAAYSRRRETGIMRLVGASNLYIQLPFILEGALAGLVGSMVASSAMFGGAWVLQTKAAPSFPFTNFVGYGTAFQISLILVVAGVGLSVLTSFVALRRYMRV
jgi:cell division transport system permease protein